MLNQLFSDELPKHTPWGTPDSGLSHEDGIIEVSTPSHGGFLLSEEQNLKIHPALRREDRAYEEDGDWAIIAHSFPHLFSIDKRQRAETILKDWKPHQYMKATGETLLPEESRALRIEEFKEKTKDKLVTIAATGVGDLVKVTATLGGDRSGKRRIFMVPRTEYRVGETNFIIDTKRHPEIKN